MDSNISAVSMDADVKNDPALSSSFKWISNNVEVPSGTENTFAEVEKEDEGESCNVCGDWRNANTMLLCDSCDRGFHIECLNPPLLAIPDDDWFCPDCSKKIMPVTKKKYRRRKPKASSNEATEEGSVEEYDDGQPCEICHGWQDWRTMLLCDFCDCSFHMGCLKNPLTEVPQGQWICSKCDPEEGEEKKKKSVQDSDDEDWVAEHGELEPSDDNDFSSSSEVDEKGTEDDDDDEFASEDDSDNEFDDDDDSVGDGKPKRGRPPIRNKPLSAPKNATAGYRSNFPNQMNKKQRADQMVYNTGGYLRPGSMHVGNGGQMGNAGALVPPPPMYSMGHSMQEYNDPQSNIPSSMRLHQPPQLQQMRPPGMLKVNCDDEQMQYQQDQMSAVQNQQAGMQYMPRQQQHFVSYPQFLPEHCQVDLGGFMGGVAPGFGAPQAPGMEAYFPLRKQQQQQQQRQQQQQQQQQTK